MEIGRVRLTSTYFYYGYEYDFMFYFLCFLYFDAKNINTYNKHIYNPQVLPSCRLQLVVAAVKELVIPILHYFSSPSCNISMLLTTGKSGIVWPLLCARLQRVNPKATKTRLSRLTKGNMLSTYTFTEYSCTGWRLLSSLLSVDIAKM